MIQVDINNVIDEIDDIDGQSPGAYDNGNGNSSTRRQKFISFFINNRSGHYEQCTTRKKIIQVDVDDTEADDTINTLIRQKIKYNLREKVRDVKKK